MMYVEMRTVHHMKPNLGSINIGRCQCFGVKYRSADDPVSLLLVLSCSPDDRHTGSHSKRKAQCADSGHGFKRDVLENMANKLCD